MVNVLTQVPKQRQGENARAADEDSVSGQRTRPTGLGCLIASPGALATTDSSARSWLRIRSYESLIGQSVVTTHLWMFSLRDSETVCIIFRSSSSGGSVPS